MRACAGVRQGQHLAVHSWVRSGCRHAPVFRAPLQLGQRDLAMGPMGNTKVALSTDTVDTELVQVGA